MLSKTVCESCDCFLLLTVTDIKGKKYHPAPYWGCIVHRKAEVKQWEDMLDNTTDALKKQLITVHMMNAHRKVAQDFCRFSEIPNVCPLYLEHTLAMQGQEDAQNVINRCM